MVEDGSSGDDIIIHVENSSTSDLGKASVTPSTKEGGKVDKAKAGAIRVNRGCFTIGRSGEADYTVNDRELSRMHFAVNKGKGGGGNLST